VRGTEATETDLVMTLERMTAIEDCDPLAGTITVQAGATLHSVQQRAEQEGLFFPLDLGARGSCTIGGNLATNAGGNRVIRYGMMRDQVLGLETVLADGSVLSSLKALVKDNTGYDLKHLFVGSEGTLGVMTRAVLRLQPKPKSHDTALVGVPSCESLPRLLRLMRSALPGTLSAFEVMWQDFYRAVTVESRRHAAPIAPDFPCYALIESLGADQARDREQFEAALSQAAEQALVGDCILAQSRSQREQLWALREETACIVATFRPLYSFDISLPLGAIAGYVSALKARIAQRWPDGGRSVVFGHLGDGNIHVVASPGVPGAAEHSALERMVYEPLADLGGSISAEHGIGLDKRAYLHVSRSPPEIETMRALKGVLDPKNLLNPGKLLPPREHPRAVSLPGAPS
jgi:FAD/FMN-containing dehydrogenase